MNRWITASAVLLILGIATDGLADPRQVRVPLRDGKLRTADLTASLGEKCRVPGSAMLRRWGAAPEIDLSGVGGSLFVTALNKSLGEGCQVTQDADALVIRFDVDELPRNINEGKRAVRDFTAEAAPDATADQRRRAGLVLPTKLDARRPLVVLVHGMDCKGHNWHPMGELLGGEGYQVAYFTYPSDQSIPDSTALFARDLQATRETFGPMRVDVIGHSLGALVARAYIEGPDYIDGGVERLILIAPPNHGTPWARARWLLEVEEHYYLWRNDPDWHLSWAITDGLGEAGAEIKPKSQFLNDLNAHPRRQGVRYTIIAGAQNPAWRKAAKWTQATANIVPDRVSRWWGLRHCERGLEKAAAGFRDRAARSDGPVSVPSTRLEGVDDVVILSADHGALYYPEDGDAPAAWETIRDRLGR